MSSTGWSCIGWSGRRRSEWVGARRPATEHNSLRVDIRPKAGYLWVEFLPEHALMTGFFEFWGRRRRAEGDFTAEIEAHLALETERLVTDGWAADAAAREARRRFGSVTHATERYYDGRHINWVDNTLGDVRYAL